MTITIQINGTYTDGQPFSTTCTTIERAFEELEFIESNEGAFKGDDEEE